MKGGGKNEKEVRYGRSAVNDRLLEFGSREEKRL